MRNPPETIEPIRLPVRTVSIAVAALLLAMLLSVSGLFTAIPVEAAAVKMATQLNVTPSTVGYFRKGAKLKGTLLDEEDAPVPDVDVIVQRRQGLGWYPIRVLTTSSSGAFSMQLDHLLNGRYRVLFNGQTTVTGLSSFTYGRSTSETIPVKIKNPKLTVSTTRVSLGKAVRVSGTVPKSASAKSVRLRELVDESWKSRGILKLNSKRSFSYSFKPKLGSHQYSVVTIPTKLSVKSLASTGVMVSVYRAKRLKSMSTMIAHGGGASGNITYTNSMNALESNFAKGHRLFELDFQWTTDGRLVAVHDWGPTLTKLFVIAPGRISYNRFMSLKMVQSQEQMDIEAVADWLREHPTATVITDVKDRNREAMRYIVAHMPDVMHRFAIQCKNAKDLKAAKNLGFSNYFFTMYNWKSTNDAAIALGKKYKPIAVSIPYEKAMKTNLPTRFKSLGIRSYAHTLNDGTKLSILNTRNVHGIFTDYLRP